MLVYLSVAILTLTGAAASRDGHLAVPDTVHIVWEGCTGCIALGPTATTSNSVTGVMVSGITTSGVEGTCVVDDETPPGCEATAECTFTVSGRVEVLSSAAGTVSFSYYLNPNSTSWNPGDSANFMGTWDAPQCNSITFASLVFKPNDQSSPTTIRPGSSGNAFERAL